MMWGLDCKRVESSVARTSRILGGLGFTTALRGGWQSRRDRYRMRIDSRRTSHGRRPGSTRVLVSLQDPKLEDTVRDGMQLGSSGREEAASGVGGREPLKQEEEETVEDWRRGEIGLEVADDSASVKSVLELEKSMGESPIRGEGDEKRSSSQPHNTQMNSAWSYLWPRAVLLFVAAVWGTNFGVVKLLDESVRSSASAMARFLLAAVALSPALLGAPKELISDGLRIGVFVFAGYCLQALALQSSEANKIAFICSLAVVFVPLVTKLMPEETEGKKKDAPIASVILAISGVGLLELGGASGPTIGDFYGLLQAMAFATGFVLNERVMAKFPGRAIALSAAQLLSVGGLSVAWYVLDSLVLYGDFDLQGITVAASDPLVFGALMYTGLVTTGFAVVLENVALQYVSASELSVLLSTEPFFAAFFSAVFLDESLSSRGIVGGVFIIAACLVGQVPETFKSRASTMLRSWIPWLRKDHLD